MSTSCTSFLLETMLWSAVSRYLSDVGLGGQADHDVQLLQLHVDGVVVLDEEHLDLLLQDLRPEDDTSHIRLRPAEEGPGYRPMFHKDIQIYDSRSKVWGHLEISLFFKALFFPMKITLKQHYVTFGP